MSNIVISGYYGFGFLDSAGLIHRRVKPLSQPQVR